MLIILEWQLNLHVVVFQKPYIKVELNSVKLKPYFENLLNIESVWAWIFGIRELTQVCQIVVYGKMHKRLNVKVSTEELNELHFLQSKCGTSAKKHLFAMW